MLETLSKRGMTKLWSGHSFSKQGMVAERKARAKEVKAAKKDPKAAKKLETKRSNPVYDIFMKWLFDIRHCVKSSESMKKLWSLDRTLCIETILQSREVAKFLVAHMGAKKLDKIAK